MGNLHCLPVCMGKNASLYPGFIFIISMTPMASHPPNMHCSKIPGSSTSEASFILHDLAKMRESCLAKTSSHCLSSPLDTAQRVLWTCMGQVSPSNLLLRSLTPVQSSLNYVLWVFEISLVKAEAEQGTEYLTCSIQPHSPRSALYGQYNIKSFSSYPRNLWGINSGQLSLY